MIHQSKATLSAERFCASNDWRRRFIAACRWLRTVWGESPRRRAISLMVNCCSLLSRKTSCIRSGICATVSVMASIMTSYWLSNSLPKDSWDCSMSCCCAMNSLKFSRCRCLNPCVLKKVNNLYQSLFFNQMSDKSFKGNTPLLSQSSINSSCKRS